jgi:hypothetical protein
MFSGRMLRFSGICRASFALCVRSNRLCSHVWRRMFARAYTYMLACAEQQRCPLLSLDRGLLQASRSLGVDMWEV